MIAAKKTKPTKKKPTKATVKKSAKKSVKKSTKPKKIIEKVDEFGLTAKESLFVEAYLGKAQFNATEAASLAGYKGNRNTLSSVGYENLRKPEIEKIISQRLTELSMGKEEVLMRVSRHARSSIADVVDDEGRFNFKQAKMLGVADLLKKIKITEKRYASFIDDEPEIIETKVEFEMYSAQAALELLAKHHGLLIDRTKHEFDFSNLSDEEITFLANITPKLKPS